tara:strand:- start:4833 stop:6245 length:1413 start_codon:yes stop_codon:yes gene_type:complete
MITKVKHICCIGAGYVGGPTMAVFADRCPDIQFYVVDHNKDRVDGWNSEDLSKLPIYEPGLKELVEKCRGKNLHFSTEVENYIPLSDMIFISVNTPTKNKGIGAGLASDLKWIEMSARQIAKYARSHTIVVEKSTLPVRTAELINTILQSNDSVNKNSNYKSFTVLSNPEFLSEGSAINDLLNPDRVLIGGNDEKSINELVAIYSNWVKKEKILKTNLWSSELSKLTANAFLAQRISSINSISGLCESTGADIKEVSLAVGTDSRIGDKFLNAGPGFGGSCFKKDILNLIYICEYYGLHEVAAYWRVVIDLNTWQQKRISNKIVEKLFGTISGKKIAIFGFSFKANTNDTRESPAINICKDLMEEGAELQIYDPRVNSEQIQKELDYPIKDLDNYYLGAGGWIYSENIYNSFIDADAAVFLTEWEEFRNINWKRVSELMRKPSWIFDTRFILDLNEAKDLGFNIWRVGLG